MDCQWAIWIDIEGFGRMWESGDEGLWALRDLMEGIFLIGQEVYPESPERIFAHQLGDGFVIVGEFGGPTLEKPIAIALALLRHLSAGARYARAAVAEGDFADIVQCYPTRVLQARRHPNGYFMGGGLMTVTPVMGTALIRAHQVSKASTKGSLLLIRKEDEDRIPEGAVVRELGPRGYVTVDWIHSEVPLAVQIAARAGLRNPGAHDLERKLLQYCRDEIGTPWAQGTLASVGLSPRAGPAQEGG
jgi:hypothetical protein